MPKPRKLPSESILRKWVEVEGMTHAQIVDRIREETGEEVSRSSVSAALSRAGFTNRIRYDEEIPWPRISVDHNTAFPLFMLRTQARMNRGLPVKPQDIKRLEEWKKEMTEKNLVVHYEPRSPEGFFYCEARPDVDTGLVRAPEPETQSA
jgi:hypothetical protein